MSKITRTRVPIRIECSITPALMRENGEAVALPAQQSRVCMTQAEIAKRVAQLFPKSTQKAGR